MVQLVKQLSAATLSCLALSCASQSHPAARDASLSIQSQLYSVALESLAPGAVVSEELSFGWPLEPDAGLLARLGVPREVITDIERRSSGRPLLAAGARPAGALILSPARFSELFAGECVSGWQAFRAALPKVNGIVRFSAIGPVLGTQQFLLYASHSLGCLHGQSRFYVLEPAGTGWRITRDIPALVF